jgi:hypothetical protein
VAYSTSASIIYRAMPPVQRPSSTKGYARVVNEKKIMLRRILIEKELEFDAGENFYKILPLVSADWLWFDISWGRALRGDGNAARNECRRGGRFCEATTHGPRVLAVSPI